MKSRGYFGKKGNTLEIRETEITSPGCNEVIVKVHACGVCGTDLNFLKQWNDEPMPLGHEIAAEVIEVGSAVTSVSPGNRVIVEDCTMCGICINCRRGRSDLCINMHSIEGRPGMGTYMKVTHNSLVPFTDLSYTHACITEPLAVSLNAVLQSDIPMQGSVAVLGCGPLGLMAALTAKIRGAGFVAVTEIDTSSPLGSYRAELARELGIDLVIDPSVQDVEEEIKKLFSAGVDRVIVSSPPESIYDALKIIGYGGIITFFGLHFGGRNTISIDINDLVFRKITLSPFFAEPGVNYSLSLELLKKGLIPADRIINRTFGFNEARQVLGELTKGSEPVMKAVMHPHE